MKNSTFLDSKEEGNGFGILQLLNLAYLAKQAWRIHSNTELPLSRVIKAKCYPATNIFLARKGYVPSHIWLGLLKSPKEGLVIMRTETTGLGLVIKDLDGRREPSNPNKLKIFWKQI